MRLLLAVLLMFALGGCASLEAPVPISANRISDVQHEIKRQVGIYMALAQADDVPRATALWHAAQSSDTRKAWEDNYWCGIGDIGYQIDSIKVEIVTSLEMNGGVSAKTPIFTALGIGSDATNSQDLQFSEDASIDQPNIQPRFVNGLDRAQLLSTAPIATVLLSMRDGLTQSALKAKGVNQDAEPCFTDQTNGTGSNVHSIKIGAQTVVSGNVTAIALAAVSLGPSLTVKDTSNTMITVNFSHHQLLTYDELDAKTLPQRLAQYQPPAAIPAAFMVRPSASFIQAAYYADAERGLVGSGGGAKATPPTDPCADLGPAAKWDCEKNRQMMKAPLDAPPKPSPADKPPRAIVTPRRSPDAMSPAEATPHL